MSRTIDDTSDAERVVQVANQLDVSEFEVFRRAHLEWYGRELDTRSLERHFASYLYFGTTPPWVRHHTRSVLGPLPRPAAAPTLRNLGVHGALARIIDSRLGRSLLS